VKKNWNETLKQILSAFQRCFRFLTRWKIKCSHMWNKTNIKHCRRCSREITVFLILVLFHFYFMLSEPLHVFIWHRLALFSLLILCDIIKQRGRLPEVTMTDFLPDGNVALGSHWAAKLQCLKRHFYDHTICIYIVSCGKKRSQWRTLRPNKRNSRRNGCDTIYQCSN